MAEQPGQTSLAEQPWGQASFSDCGLYRWWLQRSWQPRAARILFIGLNPSRADGHRDDPTLRRLIGFARSWGFGGIEVLNLFARISPHPDLLRRCPDPVGTQNDAWIRARVRARGDVALIWLGWGNQGGRCGRHLQVLQLLRREQVALRCLDLTCLGQPRHPLYCPRSLRLRPLDASWGYPADLSAAPCPVLPAVTPSISC